MFQEQIETQTYIFRIQIIQRYQNGTGQLLHYNIFILQYFRQVTLTYFAMKNTSTTRKQLLSCSIIDMNTTNGDKILIMHYRILIFVQPSIKEILRHNIKYQGNYPAGKNLCWSYFATANITRRKKLQNAQQYVYVYSTYINLWESYIIV